MPTLRVSIFTMALLCAHASVGAATATKPTELARVAILEFQDNTGQKNYGWVKTSLPDAINSSMKDQFEFQRAEVAGAAKSAEKSRVSAGEVDAQNVSVFAEQQGLDIVIFGNFSYETKTRKAVFTAEVYHHKGKRVIGTVVQQSKLNNDVFGTIDTISKKIVEHIYRFSLDLTEQQVVAKTEQSVRLLVLVPTWTNDAQKKAAVNELEVQKKELRKKYPAEFLTIFEFFKVKKTPAADQQQIEGFAKSRNDAAISDWLKAQKVTNAMIVFVSDNKVSLRPVVEGNSKPPVTYAVTASAAEKAGTIDAAVTASGMGVNLQKTTLKKDPGIRDRFSLAGGMFLLAPIGTGSDKMSAAPGIEVQALYRAVNLWAFQLGAATSLHGSWQKSYLSTGDEDFNLQHYTALAGPALIVPMPFYRSLEVQVLLLGGAAYSRLEKFKYVDTPLTFSGVNAAVSAQTEVRWHILLGVFVGAGASYHRIFYSGTDMSYLNTSLRAGYRF
jgi:hypothetical protein